MVWAATYKEYCLFGWLWYISLGHMCSIPQSPLWGRVVHKYWIKILVTLYSDAGLSPNRRKAIIRTKGVLLLTGPQRIGSVCFTRIKQNIFSHEKLKIKKYRLFVSALFCQNALYHNLVAMKHILIYNKVGSVLLETRRHTIGAKRLLAICLGLNAFLGLYDTNVLLANFSVFVSLRYYLLCVGFLKPCSYSSRVTAIWLRWHLIDMNI